MSSRAQRPLRAADALRIAAAFAWARDETRGLHFVCFDERLRKAAAHEGFTALPT